MRIGILMLGMLLIVGFETCQLAKLNTSRVPASNLVAPDAALAAKPDFQKQIRPILQSRCQPCHFQGGQVYDRLPFDRPETITKLGTRLFTRIKDEKERRLIREFLAPP